MEKKRTYGVWAVRSSTSIFGPAQSWCKENGKPLEFDSNTASLSFHRSFLHLIGKILHFSHSNRFHLASQR